MDTNATAQPITNEFVPDAGGSESTSASAILVVAYMVLWVILMLFVASNWRRQRNLATRLTQVENALKTRSG